MNNVNDMSIPELITLINSAKSEITKREDGEQSPVYVINDSGTNSVFKDKKEAIDEFDSLCQDAIIEDEPLSMYIRYVNLSDYEKQPNSWIEV